MQRSITGSIRRPTQPLSLRTQWLWAIALCTLIALLSMLNFSAYYSPRLNSDQAIHVLMAYDLQLPEDFYFWGQDRLGSLLPILAHGLLKLLPIRPVVALSIAQYAILAAGFWMLARFFKQPFISIILALVWFLPLRSFIELVLPAHPYGPQFLMVGAALLLCHRVLAKARPGQPLNQPLTLAAIALCAFLAIWISDFSALIFFCLAVVLVMIRLGDRPTPANQTFWQRIGLSRLDLLALGLASLVGIGFVAFAKSQAMRRNENYGTLSSPDQIWAAATHLAIAAWETLTFQHGFLLGIHAVLVLGSVATMGYLWIKGRSHALQLSPWFYYFLGTAILSFAALLCLAWVYHNRVSLRYFVLIYLLLWLAALSFLQSLSGRWFRRLGLLLLGTALVSSFTLPNVLSFQRPPSTIARLQPLQALAPAAFIAQPGGPYLFCAVDPENLDCTPASVNWTASCDENLKNSQERLTKISRPRCPRCTRRALAAPTIYAVEGKWLEAAGFTDDSFPKEMQQFGLCLVKVGEPIQVSHYQMAPYKRKGPAPSP
ncbi:hypothetical protein O77CONTIG1_01898 [Leptolyngbya sp. O-77]|nr:hypothetical protein O77CONTIG1_01898 [Leptolyngbya sp. O-77]